jgi:carbon monoxide dehydrogenase subunit G
MKPVTVSVDVAQPREAVYEFLAVLANHESFTRPMLVDYRCSGPERGVGAKARVTTVVGRIRSTADITVIEDVPPVRNVEENVSAKGKRRATGTYELVPSSGGGTRVSFTYAWQRAPLGDRIAAPLVRAMMRRGLQQTLERLAQQLAPSPGARSTDAA